MFVKDIPSKTVCSTLSASRLSQRMREGIEDNNPLDATAHMEELLTRKDYCSIREIIINAECDGILQPNTPTALMLGRSILDDRNAAFLLKDIGEVLASGKSFVVEKKLISDEEAFKQMEEAKKSVQRRQELAAAEEEADVSVECISGPEQLEETAKYSSGKPNRSFEEINSNIGKALEKAEAVKRFTHAANKTE